MMSEKPSSWAVGDAAEAVIGASTSIYLVRHAEAGERSDRADDHLRALSGDGRHQAGSLAAMFESADVGDILSSPYVRCVETLEPLADRLGCSVERTDALAEGAPVGSVLRLLQQVPPRSVICTHGDVMHDLMGHVAFADSVREGPDRLAKGVVWMMQRTDDAISIVEVLATPATRALDGTSRRGILGHRACAEASHSELRAVVGVAT
jgi:8-oxo-dGTP diphosphatase